MNRFILFLIRRKLGVKKCEWFQFTNQKTDAKYFINSYCIVKNSDGILTKSHVSLNWLLDKECEIKIIKEVI